MYPEHAIKVYRENEGTAPLILNLVSIIPTSHRRHQDSKSSLLIPFRETIAVFEIKMQKARTRTHTYHYGPGVDSASNRNEYQQYFLGCKGGRCVGLTTLPPSCADCLKIWEPQPPGTLSASPGL